ncbi:MAG TPA: hypothetical protein VEQ86_04890 [Xanthobacteraceae bacterium]|nr:hypothetical protein [Xanthobacteraceae bacterium]
MIAEASETLTFLAEGGRNELIDCDFRAESREAVAALAAAARATPLRCAAFRMDLEAALAGRFVFTERLFIEATIASKNMVEQRI